MVESTPFAQAMSRTFPCVAPLSSIQRLTIWSRGSGALLQSVSAETQNAGLVDSPGSRRRMPPIDTPPVAAMEPRERLADLLSTGEAGIFPDGGERTNRPGPNRAVVAFPSRRAGFPACTAGSSEWRRPVLCPGLVDFGLREGGAIGHPEATPHRSGLSGVWVVHSVASWRAPQARPSFPVTKEKNHKISHPPTFVGRELPLREIRHLLDRTLDGETLLVLITGEPGIGKTSLVEKVVRDEARFPPALWSHCWGDEGAPPYAPWTEILVALETAMSSSPAERIRPEKGPVGERTSDETRRSLPQWDSAFRRAVDSLGPQIVIFDDLHAADTASLKLLARLARTSGENGVLFLATARTRELEEDLRRREIFGRLLRIGHHFALEGLADRDITELYSITTGRSGLTTDDLRQIETATGRNPFLIREAIRHGEVTGTGGLVGTGFSLGTRAFLQERLAKLSPESRELAGFLAVFGATFPVSLIGRRFPEESKWGLKFLGELESLGIVQRSTQSAGQYRFVHDLFREALSEGLAIDIRHALHLEIAEQLISHGADNATDISRVAFHLREALPLGSPTILSEWALKAADARMDAAGASDAIEWINVALECGRSLPSGAANSPSLRKSLAQAHALAGDDDTAQAILYCLIDDLEVGAQSEAVGEATLLLAHLSPAQPNLDSGIMDLIQRAVTALDDGHEALRAGLLARSATLLYFDDLPRCRKLAGEALRAAKDSGDANALCFALMSYRTAQWGPDAMEKQRALSLECRKAAEACADDSFRFTAFHWIACDMLTRGSRMGIEKLLGDWRQEAARAIDRRPATLIDLIDGTRAFMAGRIDSAREKADRFQSELEDLPVSELENLYQFLGVQLFTLQREDGQLADLEASVRGFVEQYPGLLIWRSGLALLLAETGRAEEAYRELEFLAVSDFKDIPRDGSWLATIANCAEVASLCGSTVAARSLHALLQPVAELHVVLGMGASCWGSVHHYLGLLEEVLGWGEDAVRSFQSAIVANEAAGAAGLASYSQARLAQLLLRSPASEKRGEELLAQVASVACNRGSPRLTALVDSIRGAPVPGGVADRPVREVGLRRARFAREGEYWVVAMDGLEARLRDRRGLGQLWLLLSSPGVDFLALELLHGTGPRGRGMEVQNGPLAQSHHEEPFLDPRAFKEFRDRLKSIEEELAAAQQVNDLGRCEALLPEKEKLLEVLNSATGLGGRARRTASPAEKARINVTRTLRSALGAIRQQAPSLGAYLDRHVETGRTCRYEPDHVAPIEFELS